MQKMTKNQTQKAQPKMINLYTIVYRVFFEAFSCLYNFGACRRLAVSISKILHTVYATGRLSSSSSRASQCGGSREW